MTEKTYDEQFESFAKKVLGQQVEAFAETQEFESFAHNSGFPPSQPNKNGNQSTQAAYSSVFDYERWKHSVIASRHFTKYDPYSHQLVSLYTWMSLGNGFTVQSAAESETVREQVQAILVAFMKDRANKMSPAGQEAKSRNLLQDGEWPQVIHRLGIGKTALRRIDPLEITKKISNPKDKDEVWFYERTTVMNTGDKSEDIVRWYRDIAFKDIEAVPAKNEAGEDVFQFRDLKVPRKNDAGEIEDAIFESPSGIFEVVEDAYVNLVFINSTEERGWPILTASLKWCEAFRVFSEGRLAIQRARMLWAFKAKTQGGDAAVSAQASALRSGMSTSNTQDSNPPPPAGSALFHNKGIDYKNIDQSTQAADAALDAKEIRQQIAVAAGVMPTWLGDDNSFRLATSSAIETPMNKAFQTFQQVLRDGFAVVFEEVLANAGIAEKDRVVDLNFPPIVDKNRKDAFEMLMDWLKEYPEYKTNINVQEYGVMLFGMEHPDRVVESVGINADSSSDDAIETVEDGPSEVEMAEGKAAARVSFANALRNLAPFVEAEDWGIENEGEVKDKGKIEDIQREGTG